MNDKPARLLSERDVVKLLQTFVLFLWPVTVLAAGQSLGEAIYGIGFKDWVALLLLTNVSGLVALLTRVRKSLEAAARTAARLAKGLPVDEAEPDLQLIPWWFFALIHMLGAMFAGTLIFFFTEWLDWNSYLQAPSIALVSWGGAKYVDKWADTISDGAAERLASVFGKSNPNS